ncbi:ADP-ribosylation factor-like protein 6-interacting protein 4 [Ostrinia furnacalis]|uniref:ADP-ribosylation factor-like protein 6-interacting protein 4 n=1 Tax=Ostrinia furnacalis TaxID=93504 RepID=UPI00103E41E1|nr:ADP-ribosylation factor-like protein 6-interacting protein 4 [Ostrinia furnacalis]
MMDDSETVQNVGENEARDQPGPSRPRPRSESSSSSSSSTDSSSSDSSKRKRKRRHHRRHKRSKRAKRSDARLEQLFKEVSDLRYHLENRNNIDLDDCISLDHESFDQYFPQTSQKFQASNLSDLQLIE